MMLSYGGDEVITTYVADVEQCVWQVLVDTACAKTVAGEAWLSAVVAYLW